MELIEIAIIAISLIALLYAGLQAYFILKEDEGTDEMKRIAQAIQEGSRAFMKRQYTTIAIVAIILFVIIAIAFTFYTSLTNGLILALGFAIGAFGSAIAGYIGMHISIRANVRTANKAKDGLQKAFSLAFRGGSVTGMSVVGIALLGISIFYFWLRNPDMMVGFIFGASLISLFARVGGGIYTKGADVGADLVGKVKYGIPEDDPRNPAVIADNVGDNVGDCAGMGADLYETYVVTALASMLLAFLLYGQYSSYVILPLLFGAIGIVATLISIPFVKIGKNKKIVPALHKGIIISSIIAAIGFFVVSYYYLNDNLDAFYVGIIGIFIMAFMVFITEYYTDYKYKPTLETSKASRSGAGVTIITGLAYALQASFLPIIVISSGILISFAIFNGFSNPIEGIFGISIASIAMLSMAGIIISIDSYGPITDNAGGIAEMAGLPEDVRKVTDPLDAVGNTTKAITKGYAIGSAALAALSLFAAYYLTVSASNIYNASQILKSFEIVNPLVLVGLLIGATLPFFFTSFLMRAVGNAANAIVQEVVRQFDTIKGLMEGKAKPEYGRCVDIVTKTALRELVIPGIIGIVTPLAVGFILGPLALGGLLLGVILSGFALAIMMTVGGGSWDNAKKYIELGNFGGKGSEAHKAAVVGDTVGDALKDTAGPAINPLVKVVNTVSILFIALIIAVHLL